MRHQRCRGASSTEYALLIAVLGGVLCLGIATVAKVVVGQSFCTLGQALGADLCSAAGGSAGPGGPAGPPDGAPTDGSLSGTEPEPGPSSTPPCAEPSTATSLGAPPLTSSPTSSPSCPSR